MKNRDNKKRMKIIATIHARRVSKGIIDKNNKPFLGKSLIIRIPK